MSPRGPWLFSIDHPGVATELATVPPSLLAGPGLATVEFGSLTALHVALDRKLIELARTDPVVRMLMTAPGVGEAAT